MNNKRITLIILILSVALAGIGVFLILQKTLLEKCGDGVCDTINESCETCSKDCGECPAVSGETHFGLHGIEQFSDEMKEAGIELTREWIEWDIAEPENNQYNWTLMDSKVRKANNAGIEILGYFIQMPSWAKKDPNCNLASKKPKNTAIYPDFCEPKDWNDFREFASKVAERYDGKHGHGEMKYIEILNEVTVADFYDITNPDNLYESWLINGYQGVKDGNPGAIVLIGGFVDPLGGPAGSGEDIIAKAFIEDMLENYAEYYDIVNFHSYSPTDEGITNTIQWIKERMEIYNVDKPMWITETGTAGISSKSPEETEWAIDKLSRQIVKRYVRAFGEGVEKVFWFGIVGLPLPGESDEFSVPGKILGLGWDFPKGLGLGHEFHYRQAYYTYQLMTYKLARFSFVEKLADTQYKFIVGGESIYVLWCDSGTCYLPEEIRSSTAQFRVTDYLGNEETMNSKQITLTESPVFMEEI